MKGFCQQTATNSVSKSVTPHLKNTTKETTNTLGSLHRFGLACASKHRAAEALQEYPEPSIEAFDRSRMFRSSR
jgi:hypothetical protein